MKASMHMMMMMMRFKVCHMEAQQACLRLQGSLGRNFHAKRWGPRPIDLDIIFYEGIVYSSPQLQIPHAAWQERSFVLAPLADLLSGEDMTTSAAELRKPLWENFVQNAVNGGRGRSLTQELDQHLASSAADLAARLTVQQDSSLPSLCAAHQIQEGGSSSGREQIMLDEKSLEPAASDELVHAAPQNISADPQAAMQKHPASIDLTPDIDHTHEAAQPAQQLDWSGLQANSKLPTEDSQSSMGKNRPGPGLPHHQQDDLLMDVSDSNTLAQRATLAHHVSPTDARATDCLDSYIRWKLIEAYCRNEARLKASTPSGTLVVQKSLMKCSHI